MAHETPTWIYDEYGNLLEARSDLTPIQYHDEAEDRYFSIRPHNVPEGDASDYVYIIQTPDGSLWLRIRFTQDGPELIKVAHGLRDDFDSLGSIEADYAFRVDMEPPEGGWETDAYQGVERHKAYLRGEL